MNWRQLKSVAQLGAVIEASDNTPVAIFKHSTRCGTSTTALGRMERLWPYTDEDLPVYYLDLLQYRDVSNEIERLTGVVHESPQLIVLKDGKAVFHASHLAIQPQNVAV